MLLFLPVIVVFFVPIRTQNDSSNPKSCNDIDDDECHWIEMDPTQKYPANDPRVTEFNPNYPAANTPNMLIQQQEEQQKGPGAMGAPTKLENPSPEQKKLVEEGYQRHAFNEYLSDFISIHRSLPDYRNHWCQKPGIYSDNLLPASVVMCFHNEAYTVLLRSIHSILDRTPGHLLTEIVLVDDLSNLENLKQQLDDYVIGLPKVKLIRSDKRLGLIKARMLGAKHAQGPLLVFLDSHIEATTGWLEPMSHRITQNSRHVVCPIIDIIDSNTFEYKVAERSVTAVGGFRWDLIFVWKPATDEVLRSLQTPADPVPTPTMAGGLFAIHKDFFDRLGQYDDEYEIWGAENLEISFKTWMCGGRLEIHPCSHIGHVFRKRTPYTRNGAEVRPHRNYVRLAAVWLDDYAKYYYQKIGNNLGDYGDISSRLEIKKRLQCHNFDWYIQNVYPDIFNPKTVPADGEVRNEAFGGVTCLDATGKVEMDESTGKSKPQKPLIHPCHNSGGHQYWYLTQDGELRREDTCLDYAGGEELQMYNCHRAKGNQLWEYDADNGFLTHYLSKQCLTLNSRSNISMAPCEGWITQRWKFGTVNLDRIAELQKRIKEWHNTTMIK